MTDPFPLLFQCVFYDIDDLCSFSDFRAWYIISEFSFVTFLASSSLDCQFLFVSQFGLPVSVRFPVWTASFCLFPSLDCPFLSQFGLPVSFPVWTASSVCFPVWTAHFFPSLDCQFLFVSQFGLPVCLCFPVIQTSTACLPLVTVSMGWTSLW